MDNENKKYSFAEMADLVGLTKGAFSTWIKNHEDEINADGTKHAEKIKNGWLFDQVAYDRIVELRKSTSRQKAKDTSETVIEPEIEDCDFESRVEEQDFKTTQNVLNQSKELDIVRVKLENAEKLNSSLSTQIQGYINHQNQLQTSIDEKDKIIKDKDQQITDLSAQVANLKEVAGKQNVLEQNLNDTKQQLENTKKALEEAKNQYTAKLEAENQEYKSKEPKNTRIFMIMVLAVAGLVAGGLYASVVMNK